MLKTTTQWQAKAHLEHLIENDREIDRAIEDIAVIYPELSQDELSEVSAYVKTDSMSGFHFNVQ